MKTTLVVNLAGPPGAGKSTGAAEVFCILKKNGINCELVAEFAKDKTWEGNSKALSCQEYVFGKQSYRLARCRDDVDVIITDSPLPLSIIYNTNPAIEESFPELVMDIFNTYVNMNFYINRVKPYNPKGRNQTEEESDALGPKIKKLYSKLKIQYECVDGDDSGYKYIAAQVMSFLEEFKWN